MSAGRKLEVTPWLCTDQHSLLPTPSQPNNLQIPGGGSRTYLSDSVPEAPTGDLQLLS